MLNSHFLVNKFRFNVASKQPKCHSLANYIHRCCCSIMSSVITAPPLSLSASTAPQFSRLGRSPWRNALELTS